jgi:hypothetical protein
MQLKIGEHAATRYNMEEHARLESFGGGSIIAQW